MEENKKHITRANYQEWFLDCMDGNLSALQKDCLNLFLSENPDLEKEFQELTSGSDVALQPVGRIGFPNKSKLKRAPHPFNNISEYDFLLIKHSEDELTEKEHIQLNKIITEKPETIEELNIYSKLKLKAPSIAMPHRDSLMRRSVKASYFNYLKLAAAVILVFVIFNYRENVPLNFTSDYTPIAQTIVDPIIHEPVIKTEDVTPNLPPLSVISQTSPTTGEKELAKRDETESFGFSEPQILSLPRPAIEPLKTAITPNVYETGLTLMLPQYIENRRLMAQYYPERAASENEDVKSLLERTAVLFRNVNPLSNLAYNRIYDEEGEVVAINVSSDNFELTQRLPKLFFAK